MILKSSTSRSKRELLNLGILFKSLPSFWWEAFVEIVEEVRMYIENKYWKNYIGDTDDSLNLITFLEEQGSNKISFSKILKKIELHKQGKNFRKTVSPLGFTNSIGFDFVIGRYELS